MEFLPNKLIYSKTTTLLDLVANGHVEFHPDRFGINSVLRGITKFYSLQAELDHQDELLKKLHQAILQDAVQGKLTESWRKQHGPATETAADLLTRIRTEKAELVKAKKIKKEKPLPPISEEEVPFALPEAWVWCRLGEVTLLSEYGTSQKADLNSSNIPVFRMGNIQNGRVITSDLKYVSSTIDDLPKLFLRKGDILFNRTNSYELVGKTGVFLEENDKYTFASYLIRVRLMEVIPTYTSCWMNTNLYRESQLNPKIIQQNGQANFNGSKLISTLVPLPPLAEQRAIVEAVEQALDKVGQLRQELAAQRAAAGDLLKALLHGAFRVEEAVGENTNDEF